MNLESDEFKWADDKNEMLGKKKNTERERKNVKMKIWQQTDE